MDSHNAEFMKVASLADIPLGGTKAVRLDDKRSVALFNVDGRIYATNNQCPHMGYPLIRGTVRYGVVTCDWHGRSFDLECECTSRIAMPIPGVSGICWNTLFRAELNGHEIWGEDQDFWNTYEWSETRRRQRGVFP